MDVLVHVDMIVEECESLEEAEREIKRAIRENGLDWFCVVSAKADREVLTDEEGNWLI